MRTGIGRGKQKEVIAAGTGEGRCKAAETAEVEKIERKKLKGNGKGNGQKESFGSVPAALLAPLGVSIEEPVVDERPVEALKETTEGRREERAQDMTVSVKAKARKSKYHIYVLLKSWLTHITKHRTSECKSMAYCKAVSKAG